MIVTEFYDGQGLGNQLWCYVTTRAIANRNGFKFGIISKNKFKGIEFMNIDFGLDTSLLTGVEKYYKEKITYHPNGSDISLLDNNLLNISDNTKIDGVMQDEMYFYNIKNDVINWIDIKEEKKVFNFSSDDICIIHVRGGDFKFTPAVLDTYYLKAVEKMKEYNSNMKFFVVTDDIKFSKTILPNFEIIGSTITGIREKTNANHHIGGNISIDYNILNNAKYVIIGASSFAWWAVWTNKHCKKVIAPKYWARHKSSDGYWSTGGSITRGWDYMDKNGQIFTDNECIIEYEKYKQKNNLWN